MVASVGPYMSAKGRTDGAPTCSALAIPIDMLIKNMADNTKYFVLRFNLLLLV